MDLTPHPLMEIAIIPLVTLYVMLQYLNDL